MRSTTRNAVIAVLLAAGLALPSLATDRQLLIDTLVDFGGDPAAITAQVDQLDDAHVDVLNQALRDSVANGRMPRIDDAVLEAIVLEAAEREITAQDLRALVQGYEKQAHFHAKGDEFDAKGKAEQASRFYAKGDTELTKFLAKAGIDEPTPEPPTVGPTPEVAVVSARAAARDAARSAGRDAARSTARDTARKAARDVAKAQRVESGKRLAKGRSK
jgi:hypothetical protein